MICQTVERGKSAVKWIYTTPPNPGLSGNAGVWDTDLAQGEFVNKILFMNMPRTVG